MYLSIKCMFELFVNDFWVSSTKKTVTIYIKLILLTHSVITAKKSKL